MISLADRERVAATYSIIWSATYSHMFSKYLEAFKVICIIRLAPSHPLFTPVLAGGHLAGVSFVLVAPPILTWQSIGYCQYMF